jgi:hypothetical protein
MCFLIFSTNLSENFPILRTNERRYDKKMYIGLHVKYSLFLSDFNETRFFPTDFRKKSSNVKFHENPSSRSRVVPCGRAGRRTDGHDEANSRFSQFCERAQK